MLHPRVIPAVALLVAALFAPACGSKEAPPSRACPALIWAKPAAASDVVEVVGSWDNWSTRTALRRSPHEGWQGLPMDVPPGEYGYLLVEQGKTSLDAWNPLTTYHGDQEVSLLVQPDCGVPALRIDAVEATSVGDATLRGTFLTAASGARLDPAALRVTIDGAAALSPARADPLEGTFTFEPRSLSPGKHTAVIEATDEGGQKAPPARAAVWVKPAMESWADGVLYQIMIDRFRGDGGAPLAPPSSPGARAGGTLDGVRAEIERGTFDELGVTALWLSPVYKNPDGLFAGRDGHPYEAYHGYWPLDSRGVDPHLGAEGDLKALIDEAHRHGIRVILDFVPNHVYEKNERYAAHPGDGWFNDGPTRCVCGDAGCGWGDHIQTCWFAAYLPDVRWQQADQMRLGMEDARFWMESFDADGIRIDAVPMMPRAASRRIAASLRAAVAPRSALFTIGEVYTGPGAGGIENIRYFLGPDGIDAAFDFPLMWAARDAFATHRAGFVALESTLALGEDRLRGSGSLLGRMLDNHDTSRFLSEADGTAGGDPWASPPQQPSSKGPYRRQEMALAFLFTLPGLPILYHGDELALAGATDPDSRRVIPAPAALSADQQAMRATVRRLSTVRRCLTALRTGARVPLLVKDDTYAYLRDAGDGLPGIALFSRLLAATSVTLPPAGVPEGDFVDAFSGVETHVSAGAAIPMEAESFKILIPKKSPCSPNP